MKFVVVLILLVAGACLTEAQRPKLDDMRKKALSYLSQITLTQFLKDNGMRLKDMSWSAMATVGKRFLDGVAEAVSIMHMTGIKFIALPFEWILWSADELADRNGVQLNYSQPYHIKNTTFNYTRVNYVELNQVTPAKNQGKCGSCYAFGGIAAVEAQYLIHKKQTVDLSEQEIVDCTYYMYPAERPVANNGCKSGDSFFTAQYARDYDLSTTDKYPYRGVQGKCQGKTEKSSKLLTKSLQVDNEDHLAYLLEKNGPIVVYIRAGRYFSYYAGGVFDYRADCIGPVNHAVLVSGIEVDDEGNEQWIIKNSWGRKWGEDGFFRFPKGVNMCEMITNNVTIVSLADEIITE